MKKTNSMFCVMLLSVVLVSNVFAGGTSGFSFYGVFENMINSVVSFVSGDDGCTTRQCPNCKPTEKDGEGNCRPTQN